MKTRKLLNDFITTKELPIDYTNFGMLPKLRICPHTPTTIK